MEDNMKITKSKLGGTEMEHPSFGTLMFNRAHCGGKTALFGSSIMHNDIITMEISHAKMERDLNSDHFFGNNRIISIEMSYSQFAEAITSFGSYPGVPVTIKWTEKDGITPDCPYISKRKQFTEELKEHREKVVKESKQLISDVARIFEKKNLTKSDKEEVLSKLSRLNSDLGGNLDFINDMFNEQMDKTVQEAKGEIETFCQNKIHAIASNAIAERREEFKKLDNPIDLN